MDAVFISQTESEPETKFKGIFKDIPEAVFASDKLFAMETQKAANLALKACKTCKRRVFIGVLPPIEGFDYGFKVECGVCRKSTAGHGIELDQKDSKYRLLEALADTVAEWNQINER